MILMNASETLASHCNLPFRHEYWVQKYKLANWSLNSKRFSMYCQNRPANITRNLRGIYIDIKLIWILVSVATGTCTILPSHTQYVCIYLSFASLALVSCPSEIENSSSNIASVGEGSSTPYYSREDSASVDPQWNTIIDFGHKRTEYTVAVSLTVGPHFRIHSFRFCGVGSHHQDKCLWANKPNGYHFRNKSQCRTESCLLFTARLVHP